MRIYCLTVIKNEADVIAEAIEHARHWSDGIFVADNGSDDGTADVVRNLSERNANVHFLGVFDIPFTDAIRGEIFAHIKNVSHPGDWWCRLDADEFYIDSPRMFIEALPEDVDCIWGGCYQFYLTDRDYARHCEDPDGFERTPILERLRYYRGNWAEIKFFKHTSYLHWPRSRPWPIYMVNPAGDYLRFRHYQYRTKSQIEKRLKIRQDVLRKTNGMVFPHTLNIKQSRDLQQQLGINPDAPMDATDFRAVIRDHRTLERLGDNDWRPPHPSMPKIRFKPAWQPVWLALLLARIKYHTCNIGRQLRDLFRATFRLAKLDKTPGVIFSQQSGICKSCFTVPLALNPPCTEKGNNRAPTSEDRHA